MTSAAVLRSFPSRAVLLLVGTGCAFALPAVADVWVLEPSAAIDQRIDDNFRLDTQNAQSVSATRAVASLELSRESVTRQFKGQLRVDALLAINEDREDELDSNQIVFLESRFLRRRSALSIVLSFKQDTPSRDISADLTDLSQTASDTGATVTQDQNVDRQRFFFNPNYTYNLSRRSEIGFDYSFRSVSHGLPSCDDAISEWVGSGGNPADVFTVVDELDNFAEHTASVTGRYNLSVIDQVSTLIGLSRFEAEEERNTDVFDEKEPDSRCRNVLRNPRETTATDTARFTLGYERSLSPTIRIGGQLGYYRSSSDEFGIKSTDSGYLANLTFTKTGLITRYDVSLGLDVFPSDVGAVVESLQLVGDYKRELGPLMDFHFRARIYEPDSLGAANAAGRFARRFLSLEPRLIWRFDRTWTLAGSYRYRRQKSQNDPNPGVSNAILLSLTYTPPSEIRDLNRQGLE